MFFAAEVSMSTVYEPKGAMATLFEWVEAERRKDDELTQPVGIRVRAKHGGKVVYRKEAARRIVSDYIAMQRMTAVDKPSEIVRASLGVVTNWTYDGDNVFYWH
jgi:hypothetical protein